MKSSILTVLCVLLSTAALAAEPKFLKPVACATESGDKQVIIHPDGKFELQEKDKAAKSESFENCRFKFLVIDSVTEKLPTYVCSSKGRKTGYLLEANLSGYYNLMETGDFRGMNRNVPNSSDPALRKIRDTERKIGTFKCSDPTMDAWVAAENAARGQAQPNKPTKR